MITPPEAIDAIVCGMEQHRSCGKYGHKVVLIGGEAIGIAEPSEIAKMRRNCVAVQEIANVSPQQISQGLTAEQWWSLAVRVTLAIMRPELLDD